MTNYVLKWLSEAVEIRPRELTKKTIFGLCFDSDIWLLNYPERNFNPERRNLLKTIPRVNQKTWKIRFKNLSKFYSSNCNELKIIYRTLTSKMFWHKWWFFTKIYTRKSLLVVSWNSTRDEYKKGGNEKVKCFEFQKSFWYKVRSRSFMCGAQSRAWSPPSDRKVKCDVQS